MSRSLPGGRRGPIARAFVQLFAGSVVLALVAMGGAHAGAQTSGAASSTGARGEGLSTLGACVDTNRTLLVELLVDTSGSLQSTDPTNERVPALRAALGSLLSLTRQVGLDRDPVRVEVQISSFDADYVGGGGFTALDSDSISGLLESTDSFRSRNVGNQTDYVLALRGAARALAARSSELTVDGGEVCKAVLWFTDGEYAIGNALPGSKDYAPGAGPDEAIAAGLDALCRPGGIADQLRVNDVVNVAVALTGPEFTTEDLKLLAAIVVGDPRCGDEPNPGRQGVLLDVGNVELLTSGMLAAFSGSPGIGQDPGRVCDQLPCERRVDVEVPAGVGSFYLLTSTTAQGAQRWLSSPDASEPVLLNPGGGPVTLGSSSVEPLVISATTVMIDVTLDPSSPATGTWSVDFVDPTGDGVGDLAQVEVYLFGALRPDLVGTPEFRQGETVELEVQVVDGNGNPVGGDLASQTQLAVTVVDPVTAVVSTPAVDGPDDDGIYRFDYVASSDSTAAALNTALGLSVVLDDGLALRPVVVEYAVPVAVPSVVPELVDGSLSLGSVEGDNAARGTLAVAGPERGEGRVCLRAWDTRLLPEGVSAANLVSPGSCVSVAAGATTTIDVEVAPSQAGTGTARGILEVSLESADGTEQTTRSVPVVFDMLLAPNRPVQLALAGVLTALGVGLPLLIFWALSRFLTTFRGLDALQWTSVPVRVDRSGVQRITDGAAGPLAFSQPDWRYAGGGRARSFGLGTDGAIRVSVLHRTFRLSDAIVEAAGLDVVGSAGSRTRRGRRQGIVPLELSGSWALIVDQMSFDQPSPDSGPERSDAPWGSAPTTDADGNPPYTVMGRLVAFIDDRHEWVQRASLLANGAASGVPDMLTAVVERHRRELGNDEAVGSPPGAGVSVGAGTSPPGQPDQPPWARPGGTAAAPPQGSDPGTPPWANPSGPSGGSNEPERPPW